MRPASPTVAPPVKILLVTATAQRDGFILPICATLTVTKSARYIVLRAEASLRTHAALSIDLRRGMLTLRYKK
jgi:hypothetical protein